MSEDSLFGDADRVLTVGLLISSYMNFGGYHSFVETFPIEQAVASNSNFDVVVDARQKGLYREMVNAVSRYAPAAAPKVRRYLEDYDQATNLHRINSMFRLRSRL